MTGAVRLLTGLLEHFSPTREEAGAVRYLGEAMSGMGYEVEVDAAGNVVGRLGRGPRQLLLAGHVDTVAGQIEVRREGDRLYGRGAVDAKGPLACFITAAARLGPRPGWTIRVAGAVGEEGSSEGAKYIRDQYPPADFLIIGEPSGWQQLVLGYKGSLWLEYSANQPAAHPAGRDPSACDLVVQFLQGLEGLAGEHNHSITRRFDQLTYSIREMDSCQDGFSQSARAEINLRLPPDLDYRNLEQQLGNIAVSGAWVVQDYTPAYRAEKNNPLVRSFLRGIRSCDGMPTFVLKSGTSDMNILGPAWDCPALAYGPGDSNLDHTPDEHISIGEYLKGIDVLEAALVHLTDDEEGMG